MPEHLASKSRTSMLDISLDTLVLTMINVQDLISGTWRGSLEHTSGARTVPCLCHIQSREGCEHLPAPGMVRTRQFEHHPSLYSLGQAERGKGHGADELVIVRDKAS